MDIDSIYRLYFRDVFLFLQGLTHNEALAEELTQETFFKALDGLKDYDDRQDVRAWLFTVARNAYYSHCRRTKRTAPLEDAETRPRRHSGHCPAAGRSGCGIHRASVSAHAGRALQRGVQPPGIRRAAL